MTSTENNRSPNPQSHRLPEVCLWSSTKYLSISLITFCGLFVIVSSTQFCLTAVWCAMYIVFNLSHLLLTEARPNRCQTLSELLGYFLWITGLIILSLNFACDKAVRYLACVLVSYETLSRLAPCIILSTFIILLPLLMWMSSRFFHRPQLNTNGVSPEVLAKLTRFQFEDRLEYGVGRHYKCVVCLEDYSFGETITLLDCLHTYHSLCIDQWLTRSQLCPICRFTVT